MNYRTSDYRSFGGALWSLLGPLAHFAVMYFIFEDRFGRQIPHFSLHLLAGILPVTFLNGMVSQTMRFFERVRSVLINTTTPSETLMLSSLFVPFLKFLVEIMMCGSLAIAFGLMPPAGLLYLAALSITFMLLVLGIGLHLLILNSLAGDVSEIWQVTSNMLIFITPTFYTLDMLSPWARTLVRFLNPLTPFIIGFQSLVGGQPVPYYGAGTLPQAIVYSCLALASGYWLFKHFEKQVIEKT